MIYVLIIFLTYGSAGGHGVRLEVKYESLAECERVGSDAVKRYNTDYDNKGNAHYLCVESGTR